MLHCSSTRVHCGKERGDRGSGGSGVMCQISLERMKHFLFRNGGRKSFLQEQLLTCIKDKLEAVHDIGIVFLSAGI